MASKLRVYVREVDVEVVKRPYYKRVLYIAGRTEDGRRVRVNVLDFRREFFVNLDGIPDEYVGEIVDTIMGADKDADVTSTERYPTYCTKNRKVPALRVLSNRYKKLKEAFEEPMILGNARVRVHFDHQIFNEASQLLYRTDLRIMSLVEVSRARVKGDGIYEVSVRTDTFRTISSEVKLTQAFVRLRCVSHDNINKRMFLPDVNNERDYIAACTVIRVAFDGQVSGASWRAGERGEGEEALVRAVHEQLKDADVLIALQDNYDTFMWLQTRMVKYGLRGLCAYGRAGVREKWGSQPARVSPHCGMSLFSVQTAMAKEFVPVKLEGTKLVDFVEHSFFWGPEDRAPMPRPAAMSPAVAATMLCVSERGRAILEEHTRVEARALMHIVQFTGQLGKATAAAQVSGISLEVAANMGVQPRAMGLYIDTVYNNEGFLAEEFYKQTPTLLVPSTDLSSFDDVEDRSEIPESEMDEYHLKNYRERKKSAARKAYPGGICYTPRPVYLHDRPAFCLDFAGMYPSEVVEHKLGHATIVCQNLYRSAADVEADPDVKVMYVPKNESKPLDEQVCVVVMTAVRVDGEWQEPVCFLDKMVKQLLAMRKAAKTMMKNAKDATEREQHNARQLAIKLVANGVYGFCGADDEMGKYPLNDLAAVITSLGRYKNRKCENLLRRKYDFKVLYGDTDSVIGTFPKPDVAAEPAETYMDRLKAAYWEVAERAAADCTAMFTKPTELEAEAAYWPLLLIRDHDKEGRREKGIRTNGKRKFYITVTSEGPNAKFKLKQQGHGSQRRDYCHAARRATSDYIRACFPLDAWRRPPPDLDMLNRMMHDTLQQLVLRKLSLDDLAITMSIMAADKYKQKTAVQLRIRQMVLEKDGYELPDGERVAFVYVYNRRLKNKKDVMILDHLKRMFPSGKVDPSRVPIDYVRYLESYRTLYAALFQEEYFWPIRDSFYRAYPVYEAIASGQKMALPVIRPLQKAEHDTSAPVQGTSKKQRVA